MGNKQEASYFRHVIGGKGYDGGNHVWVINRHIGIEFDSDFHITKRFNGKNWFKLACKQAEKIPNPVTLKWLEDHGYEIPKEIKRYA